MSRRAFLAAALLILAIGGVLRSVWLTSDPPSATNNGVGIVWHDEGPWTHNARNKALWGVWVTDNWNPVYIAPVFTALEYASFRAFGVGTEQARIVPIVSGLAAVAFLMAGLAAAAGRKEAVIGGALLAANYVSVMWNRAALMESTMTAFIVISWGAYALSSRRPVWGTVAGVAAMLAFFTKASAAFFVAGIAIDALLTWRRPSSRSTLAGLAACGAIVGAVFVLPHLSDFTFYNWQMSVTRKPDYTLKALKDRASWLPLVNDFFMWMWPAFAAACAGIIGIALRWRTASPAERLLLLWVVIGFAELAIHDSGNERRYVMFMPALAALAALWLTSPPAVEPPAERWWDRWTAGVMTLAFGYLVGGSLVRLFLLDAVHARRYFESAMIATALAALTAIWVTIDWKRARRLLISGGRLMPRAIAAAVLVVPVAIDGVHFGQWAASRQDLNYRASVEVGRLLPPGTLVHGKLANGLALENRIRPVFIGHGFGNYEDRLRRDDVRYILTYVSPSVGFESQAGSSLIQEILDRYPGQVTVATFAVNETGGPDRAALIDKLPGTDRRARD